VKRAAHEASRSRNATPEGVIHPTLNVWFFWPAGAVPWPIGTCELLLLLGDVGQDWTDALVLDNRSLVDLRLFVEGAVGHGSR
jgi:hypothetical protein